MEDRRLLASDLPVGITPVDTGEFLLGTVTVTPVFFESNGAIDPQTQNWTESEIDATLLKIRDSVDFWSDLLATKSSVHTLDFVIDDTYARNPVETGYEPIDNPSSTFNRYVGNWVTDLGYGDAPSIERAVALFNHSQREAHQTDWAFTIFVVDSSDDDDGFFAAGGFVGAFAYPGGLFIVIPSGRPVSTYSHEMGHIFYARDEYPGAGSWTDERGYYNAQNLNASDNPTPGFVQEDSIMRGGAVATRAYETLVSPESTLAMIGWRDSDGDGIFDLADVPIQLDAVGTYDVDSGVYSFSGSAAVDTLANQNSEGFQSDITLARISHLQYQINGGAWLNALSPDATQINFDVQLPISSPDISFIAWRAIDTTTGITSPVLSANVFTPLFSGVGGGFVYLDDDTNSQHSFGESLLGGTQFLIRRGDGSNLFHQAVTASGLPDGAVVPPAGMTLITTGERIDGRVGALVSKTDGQYGRVFQYFDTAFSEWQDRWGAKRKLDVSVAESTGRVEIDFVALDTGSYGLDTGSYARVEAYDSSGNQIDRVTSELVPAGSRDKLVVEDSNGRIARVVVYGHAETEILISSIAFGQPSIMAATDDGAFSVDGLPDGDYQVELVTPNLIYQLPAEPVAFQVTGGTVATIAIAANRVDSPRYNASMPGDVNGDQEVTARDALAIINDIARLDSRVLAANETTGLKIDVNNDGRVSALDALRVINMLAIASEAEGEAVQVVAIKTTTISNASNPADSGQSSYLTQPSSLMAVDAVFGPHYPDNWLDRDASQDQQNQKTPDFEGQRTSDQSILKLASDRPSEADVHDTGDSGANAGLERPLWGFSHLDGEIERDSAVAFSPL